MYARFRHLVKLGLGLLKLATQLANFAHGTRQLLRLPPPTLLRGQPISLLSPCQCLLGRQDPLSSSFSRQQFPVRTNLTRKPGAKWSTDGLIIVVCSRVVLIIAETRTRRMPRHGIVHIGFTKPARARCFHTSALPGWFSALRRDAGTDLAGPANIDALAGTNALEQSNERILPLPRCRRIRILEHVLQDLHVGLRDIGPGLCWSGCRL